MTALVVVIVLAVVLIIGMGAHTYWLDKKGRP